MKKLVLIGVVSFFLGLVCTVNATKQVADIPPLPAGVTTTTVMN